MRRSLAACLLPLSLLLATPAVAGPVSQVARGVENKVQTHSNPPSPPSPPDPPSTPDPPSYDDGSSHIGVGYGQPTGYYEAGGRAYYMVPPCGADCDGVLVRRGGMRWEKPDARRELLPGPVRLDLYAGAHSVIGSQGALVGELRVSKAWIGMSASGTSYFERVEGADKRPDQTVRLDLMSFAVNGRIAASGPSEMWLDVGLAATTSSEYDAVLGAMAGLRFEHQLGPELGVAAQGRMYRMESDVSAVEGWAGVRAWFVRAGYRALRFNVGPALHGPEAGVAFEF